MQTYRKHDMADLWNGKQGLEIAFAIASAQVLMRRLPALVAALLLPAAQPALLGTAISAGALLVAQAPTQAQSSEAVAKVAQTITVRVEGATQGSGVLVKRDGNRYTVLTAWHVVSGQRPGEELDVYTPDGQRHKVEQGSIKRLGDVDMAVLSFSSSSSYEVALVGDVKSVSSGSGIYVAGFPLPTSAVPTRIWRFLKGEVIANATVAIPNGYQLLYSNQTLPGMSGGAVMNAQGQLVGIHGQGETDSKMSEQQGVAVKTGSNQAVPIAYYSQYSSGAVVVASTQAATADDYLAQARALLGKKGSEQEVIRLTNQVLAARQSAEAYFYRAHAKFDLGDKQGAIADYSQDIAINPQNANSYFNRGIVKSDLGDKQGAIADYNQAIAINPQYVNAYNNRGNAKSALGDKQGAIIDYNQAIAIDPKNADAYFARGVAKHALGDKQGAITDYSQAIAVNPQYAAAYTNRGNDKSALGDKQGAITDYNQAIAIDPKNAGAYLNRGNDKHGLGDKQGAIADYNQSIAIDPRDPDAYYNRGNAKYGLGDMQGAVADYSQAIVINPQHAAAYSNRGNVKFALGDKQGACTDFKKAVSLGSQSAAQWFNSERGAWCRNMP